MTSIGPLVPADELLIHQITDTFGTVGQSDRSWTEKVWVSAYAPDGSLQVDLGFGLYPNRGVVDGFAGASRCREQWTVRASRELTGDVSTGVGPIHYDVVEPLSSVRIRLDAQDVVPVSFDLRIAGVVPAYLEERELKRSADGRRIDSDIVRFHQAAMAVGWVQVDGKRIKVDDWTAGRDRSWGVRYMIGAPVTDVARGPHLKGGSSLSLWSTAVCEQQYGERYALHFYLNHQRSPGRSVHETQGAVERSDGSRELFDVVTPDLRFDPVTRRLLGGVLHARAADGAERPITLTALGDTGFHLGAGRYFSFDGKWPGQWEGLLHVEGEHIPDCTDLDQSRRLHQLRDCVVRFEDPVGGGIGVGTVQTIAIGAPPGTDLSAEGSFI